MKRKLSKLGRGTLEYFLGTETSKYYKDLGRTYREYFLDKIELTKSLSDRGAELRAYILIGKVYPNLVGALSTAVAYSTDEPAMLGGIAMGESFRLIMNKIKRTNVKRHEEWKEFVRDFHSKESEYVEEEDKKDSLD